MRRIQLPLEHRQRSQRNAEVQRLHSLVDGHVFTSQIPVIVEVNDGVVTEALLAKLDVLVQWWRHLAFGPLGIVVHNIHRDVRMPEVKNLVLDFGRFLLILLALFRLASDEVGRQLVVLLFVLVQLKDAVYNLD